MVAVITVVNVKQLPFNCDHLPDKWPAFARNVMRTKLSSRLTIIHLQAFYESTPASKACEDQCYQDD